MKTAIKAGLAVLFMQLGTVWSAPITFNTALPVRENGWVLREQLIYMKNADDPTPAKRDMRVAGGMSVLGYGVNRDFVLFAMLPWFDKRLDMTMDGQGVTRRERGIGDLTMLGRYTAYEDNAPGRTFRIAPFLGIKMPTGDHNARDSSGRLPLRIQPGSGSWDILAGVVATWQTLDFQIDSQASYKANREANGVRAGDVSAIDGSVQYRLWPRSLGHGVPAFLYGVLEVNLEHADKDRLGGVDDRNSGGTTLFLSPGLQYVTRKWIIEAGVQMPVIRNPNGTALTSDYVVTTGFRINF